MALMDMPQFDLPFLEVLPALLYMGAFMVLLLTALCGPVVAVIAETGFIRHKKAFYDKFGLQSAQLSFWAALPMYLFFFAYLHFSLKTAADDAPLAEGLQSLLPGMAVPVLWAALFLLYRFTWNALKRAKALHLLLGYCSALLGLGTLFIVFLGIVCIVQPTLTELLWDKTLPTAEVFSSPALYTLIREFAVSPASWCFFLYLLGNGFAAAGCLILPWLMFQRKFADYGRDYYSFAMRHAAGWACAAQGAAMAMGGALFYVLWESPLHSLAQPQEPLAVIIACALPVCCMILWGAIVAGKNPLRHKPGAIVACFLFFAAVCAQFFTFLSALPVL